MSDQLSRSPRTVTVADHLWDTYALMSAEMGVDRDGLVNQALFAFARGHGYLIPGSTRASMPPPSASPVVEAPAAFTPAPAPAVSAAFQSLPSIPPVPAPAPAVAAPSAPEFTPSPLAAAASVPDDATPASSPSPTAPSSAVVPELTPDPKATAAIRVRSTPTPAQPVAPAPAPSAPSFAPAPAPAAPPPASTMSPEEVRAAQERVLQKAAELERLVRGEDSAPPAAEAESLPADLPVEHDEGTPVPAAAPEPTLVIYAEGREVDRVTSERFLIGRGKHCDLIINSGKVSREHAAIMREGDVFYIEDLGSSNGTWFDKKRITRRRVEDGDEYFVCSEKLSCRVTY